MNGADVPYHLRPNKYVDRQLFINLLSRIDRIRSMSGYVYISMGGKFLEDHRAIHLALDIEKMYSFDLDQNTVNRQNFNKPFEKIECFCKSSEDFVNDFSNFAGTFSLGTNFIVWLDYTDPGQRLTQLQEFARLIEYAQAFDIVRITVNATISTLGAEGRLPAGFANVRDWRLACYRSQLSDFAGTPQADYMRQSSFPTILAHSVGLAAKKAARATRNLVVRPLAVFSYSDGPHTMLTSTGIVLPRAAADAFMENEALKVWPHLVMDWDQVARIDVPDLSIVEKVHVDRLLLSKSDGEIHDSLGFSFDNDTTTSIAKLTQYRIHYKLYPHFMRVLP